MASATSPLVVTAAEAPATNSAFRMSAPMIFPTARSPCPRRAACTAVISSGSEVPNATIVAAMTDCGTPHRTAMILIAGIRTFALRTTPMIARSSFSRVRIADSFPSAPCSGRWATTRSADLSEPADNSNSRCSYSSTITATGTESTAAFDHLTDSQRYTASSPRNTNPPQRGNTPAVPSV